MQTDARVLKKVREIQFSRLLSAQAQDAQKILEEQNVKVVNLGNGILQVEYNLHEHSLMQLETLLVQKGFFLDQSFWAKSSRILIYYAEEIEKHNLNAPAPKLKRIPEGAFVQVFQKRNQKREEKNPPSI